MQPLRLTRFCQLSLDKLDGRTIEGVVMRYGDEGKIGPDIIDIIEPGAFGTTDEIDIVLNVQHTRGRAIARTGGAGLAFSDSLANLSAKATLADTTEGNDTLTLVRAGILKGFSLEYLVDPQKAQSSRRKDGKIEFRISKAQIVGLAVVDTPAYPDSKIVRAALHQGMNEMDHEKLIERMAEMEKSLRSVITEATEKKGYPEMASELVDMVKGTMEDTFKAQLAAEAAVRESDKMAIDDAKMKMATMMRDRDKMKAERDEAQTRVEELESEVRAATEAKDELEKGFEERIEKEGMKRAAERAELLVLTAPLLPEGFDTAELTDREILVKAAGDEVPNAEERHAEYLRAKVEDIALRRGDGTTAPTKLKLPVAPTRGTPTQAHGHVPNVLSLIAARTKRSG